MKRLRIVDFGLRIRRAVFDRASRIPQSAIVLLAAPLGAQALPPLPDSSGWGVHVLALARAPDSSLWAGSYGQGIFVLRQGASSWEHIRVSRDTAAHSISFDFVHAFAFGPRGQIWYGTVGNGWGLSTDGGKTWRNWEFGQLGPEWQYVAPNGIVTWGDTTYIGTADGIKLTFDDGATWHEIVDSAQTVKAGTPWGRLDNEYVVALSRNETALWVSHRRGGEGSHDGGRTWNPANVAPVYDARLAALTAALSRAPLPLTAPPAASPAEPRHSWFRRPIVQTDQPYIDQTYRYGSTMGGNFQQHQGVEFNNPDGTPVHAIGDGEVVWAGPAERGALTVAIEHSRRLSADGRQLFVFSVYYHNSKLLTEVGKSVKAGDVIALVGNTGRATNDHLHLEVHPVPFDSVRLVVNPEQRFPPYTTNPELWIEPMPGTGLVAGQVWDSQRKPVLQARIYGIENPSRGKRRSRSSRRTATKAIRVPPTTTTSPSATCRRATTPWAWRSKASGCSGGFALRRVR
jgi:murein DD-endopeptidase MepM/ murein hydrolase activator NlpD